MVLLPYKNDQTVPKGEQRIKANKVWNKDTGRAPKETRDSGVNKVQIGIYKWGLRILSYSQLPTQHVFFPTFHPKNLEMS